MIRIFVVLLLLIVPSCYKEEAKAVQSPAVSVDRQVPIFDTDVSAEEIPTLYAEAVRYNSEDYQFHGPIRDGSRLFDGYEYRRSDSQRLLLLNRTLTPGVWAWFAVPQVLVGDKWVEDGQRLAKTQTGEVDSVEYMAGTKHGWSRSWYPNGQLHIEEPYVNGKKQGIGRGWYESGAKQWETTFAAGSQLEGTAWREDGSEY